MDTTIEAEANGITFPRNTQEVLSIVYGGGKGGGAFFPSGPQRQYQVTRR